MKLALSSAGAPDARLDDLLAACRRRGFAALELEEGHAHGVGREVGAATALASSDLVAAAGFRLAGLRLRGAIHDPGLPLQRLQEALAAPLILDADAAGATEAAALLAARGEGRVLMATRTPLQVVGTLPPAVGVAWDVAPADQPDGREASVEHCAIVEALGRRLRHVRLLGGGPETDLHEGRGVGTLMGLLALSGFAGTLAVAPSSDRFRVAWGSWLGRRGGWGCGGASESPELVHIGGAAFASSGGGGRP